MRPRDRTDRNCPELNDVTDKRRRWLEEIRRRRKLRDNQKRRFWAWLLFIQALDNLDRQVKAFAVSLFARLTQPRRPSHPNIKNKIVRTFDMDEHIRRDCASRPGEAHLEIMDGMTHLDIQELKDRHRPRIPGLPARYDREWPHIWTLLDHLQYPWFRKDAIKALKMSTPRHVHAWVDECAMTNDGWKDIRKCRRETRDATVAAIQRVAWQAGADRLREIEEIKKSMENRNQEMVNEDLSEPPSAT